MKKNIFTILALIILFTICSVSSASEVKIISSGNENNVFETTGTLRVEWKEGDDCDYLGLIKMYFIPDNPTAFGGKIAYVWAKDMSDAVLWKKAQKLGYKESEEEDKKAGEEVLKLAKRIFKNPEIKNGENGHEEIAVKIRLKSLKPVVECNNVMLYSEFVNAEEIKVPKVTLSEEKYDTKLAGHFTVGYTVKSPNGSANIMEKPDANSKVVKRIGKNDTVGEIQDFGEWVFVYYRNTYPDFTYGYVRKSELKKNIRHPFENIDLFN